MPRPASRADSLSRALEAAPASAAGRWRLRPSRKRPLHRAREVRATACHRRIRVEQKLAEEGCRRARSVNASSACFEFSQASSNTSKSPRGRALAPATSRSQTISSVGQSAANATASRSSPIQTIDRIASTAASVSLGVRSEQFACQWLRARAPAQRLGAPSPLTEIGRFRRRQTNPPGESDRASRGGGRGARLQE